MIGRPSHGRIRGRAPHVYKRAVLDPFAMSHQTETELTETTEGDLSQGEALLNRASPSHGTMGQNWTAWRFTTPFKQRILEIFQGRVPFLAGFETSKTGVKHFHVVTLEGYDKIRKAIQRIDYWKSDKNMWWSKNNSGTLAGAVSYTMKGGDTFQSDDWPAIEYTPWVHSKQPTIPAEPASKRAKPDPDRDWQLTYSNLVTQAYKYHRTNGMATDMTLRQTVQHMIQHTKWRPSIQLVKTGVPDFYSSDFEMRIGGRTVPDMAWWNFHVC